MSEVLVARPDGTRTAEPVTTADVLHRAADLLEEFDWCQGNLGRNGAYCAMGAIGAVVDRANLSPGEWYVALDVASFGLPASGTKHPLAHWNDEPGRTKAEVVARLREAAERSREAASTASEGSSDV